MEEIKMFDIEEKMIWLDDPTKYDYLRRSNFTCCSPNYKPIKKNELFEFEHQGNKIQSPLKMIGYSKPKLTDKESGIYTGTYYWLKPYDSGMPYENVASDDLKPSEAVKINFEIKDGFPIVKAKPRDDGVAGFMFWCPFCNDFHRHGIGEGHRSAHCTNPDSPLKERGYIIKRRA